MKYLCLIYQEQATLDALSEQELEVIMEDVFAYREELRQRGYYIASSPLQPIETAATVQVRHGHVSVTDGPFVETKEQIGGFYLIEARDLNEALRIASRMPPARIGTIEIRQLHEVGPAVPPSEFLYQPGSPAIAAADSGSPAPVPPAPVEA